MIRLAFAALVFFSTLCAALGQMTAGVPDARESARAATTAPVPRGCTPTDDHGEWRPQHDPTASISESAWKWRTLHAELAAIARPAKIVAIPLADPPTVGTPGAPSYLLHTPLLI